MSEAAQSWTQDRHPEAWRRRLTASEPGVPWVTYYQPSTGVRVELSRVTFDNWVAKASGLLAEECDVEPGSAVMLDLEPHWLLPVWAWATWSLGATVVLPGLRADSTAHAAVLISDDFSSGGHSSNGGAANGFAPSAVLRSSRHPLGLPANPGSEQSDLSRFPTGVIDALAEVRMYPDVRTDPVPEGEVSLIRDGETTLAAGAALAQLLSQKPVRRAAMLRSRPRDAVAFARAILGPAFHSGALVIIEGGTPDAIAAIGRQEQADVDLG